MAFAFTAPALLVITKDLIVSLSARHVVVYQQKETCDYANFAKQ